MRHAFLAREVQRTLGDLYPEIDVMATSAVQAHDGCHFFYDGYTELGELLNRLVQRDLYGSLDTQEIDPPAIDTVQWASPAQDALVKVGV